MKDQCFMLQKGPPCYIQLGRFGDLIILLPAFKAVHDRTGLKPVVVVSHKYSSVLNGVSYVQPWAIGAEWWDGVPHARQLAREHFANVMVPQWWNDPDNHDNLQEKALQTGGIVLQCHGREWGVNMALWPNYMTSMWDRAGFTREEMMTLPLVFDRRNSGREQQLAYRYINAKKPLLLYNFTGISSPFSYTPEVLGVLRHYTDRFQLVNIGNIKCTAIYDLLGLYDIAAGLVTTDTATLHLAATGTIPYAAYTVDGWTSSVPRGTCRLEVKYGNAKRQLDDLHKFLTDLSHDDTRLQQVLPRRPGIAAKASSGGGYLVPAAMAGARH